MEDLAVYGRLILALLFLSTAWSKFQGMGEHIGIVRDYRVVPDRWAEPFARGETWVEFLLAALLLIGLLQPYAAAALVGLLTLYTAAIVINLFRGRTEMSCGCGGAAGNHRLSWRLVLRNITLGLVGIGVALADVPLGTADALLGGASLGEVLNFELLVLVFMAGITMTAWTAWNEMNSIRTDFLNIAKGE